MSQDNITYDHAAVAEFAADVSSRSSQLMEIHDDMLHRTNSIAEFFQGSAAGSFHDAQMQMLSGLQNLIETMNQHGSTICQVNDGAHHTDLQMGNLF